MAVTDLRTLLDDGFTSVASWVDTTGSAAGGLNSDVAPPGASADGSISDKVSKKIEGLMYDDGGTGTFGAGDHIFMWYYVLFGALDTLAGAGVRFRVTGATVTDWAEVVIDGSDSGKSGWQLAVVSIDQVVASGLNNGTPPTAAQIQRMGIIIDITGTVGGNNDNFAVQAIYHQPAALVGSYRVDAGTDGTPNTWETVLTQVETDTTGVVVREPNGTITLNGPIVFGPASGVVDTTFEDTGVVLAFKDNSFVEADFYKLAIDLPASYTGDARVTAGTKVGTGETAIGVNGWTILTGGARYTMEFENADQTDIQFYGCSFQTSGVWSIDDTAVEIISCVFSDCDTLTVTGNATTGPVLLSNTFIAAPGTGPQIDLLANPRNGQFDFNAFNNMTDFGIEISENGPVTYDLRGVKFAGNGANGDIEFTNASNLVTVNILEDGDVPSVTQTGAGTNEILLAVSIEINGVTEGTRCVIETDAGVPLLDEDEGLAFTDDGQGGFKAAGTFAYVSDQDVRVSAASSGKPVSAASSDNNVFSDETVNANSATTNDMTLLPAVPVVSSDDGYVFGHTEEFAQMDLVVTTAGTGGFTIAWQYWNGSIWTALSGVSDGTSSFSSEGTGRVSWTIPGDWTARTISSQLGTTVLFYIRALYSAGTVTIVPVGRQVTMDVTKYLRWEDSNTVTSTGLATKATWVIDTIAKF